MIIKRTKQRLKPGTCCSFFRENKKLYQDLKAGKDVEIPDLAKEEVLEHFLGLIETVKKKKVKNVIDNKDKGKEVDK